MKTPADFKVVMIDDDSTMVQLFKTMLKRSNYSNVEVVTDLSMCPLLQTNQCECTSEQSCADAVIVDIMMPGMNGIEFLELQKARGCKIPEQNRALMTAGAKLNYKRAAQKLGCHIFFKPFKLTEIEQWLDESRMRAKSNI